MGVIICSVISKCYHPPPNPLPSREGEFWAQEILKIFPRHDTRAHPLPDLTRPLTLDLCPNRGYKIFVRVREPFLATRVISALVAQPG